MKRMNSTFLIAEVPNAGYEWFLHKPWPRNVRCSCCRGYFDYSNFPPPKFQSLEEALDWCIINGVFLDWKPEPYEP